jgi:hypothetical protein
MELPQELYVYLYEFTNDVKDTKALRLVSNTAYKASYDYFKILLREPIMVKCNRAAWFLGTKEVDCPGHRFIPILPVHKIISFPMTVRDLYHSIHELNEGVTMDYNCAK